MNIRKVSPYLTNAVQNSGSTGQTGADDKAAGGNGVSTDRVQLSQNYLDLAQAQKNISGSGDIRTDKVQDVKNQIDSGSYTIDPTGIAQKMVDEIV